MSWENAIVGYEEMPVGELVDNPENWRLHPQEQLDALAASLAAVGLIQTVIWNRQTGHIIDGHARVKLARDLGEATVPVTVVDLAPEREAKAIALFDSLGALALTDEAKMSELLGKIMAEDEDLSEVVREIATNYAVADLLEHGQDPEFEFMATAMRNVGAERVTYTVLFLNEDAGIAGAAVKEKGKEYWRRKLLDLMREEGYGA